ncbi:HU family DNA-binding protein [Salmonella enterica]|nr:HU family DNA-binding protein [Salmonella enterica]EKK6596280.1 HU family DNA-binding protein [Salmonella enterica]
MTKSELIACLGEHHHLSRAQVTGILNDFTELLIQDLLSTGEAKIPGIGQLKVVQRAARKGRNPQTGKECDIPAANVLKFQTTKVLKEQLN